MHRGAEIRNEHVRLQARTRPELERVRRQAVAKREELEQVRTPMSTSKKSIQQTMDEKTGLIENAALGCAT